MGRHMFEKNGEILTTFCIHNEQGSAPITLPFDGDDQKEIALNIVKMLCFRHKVYAYTFSIESYMLSVEIPEGVDPKKAIEAELNNPNRKPIKDNPNRIEALNMAYVGYDTRISLAYPIKRVEGKKPMLGREMRSEGNLKGTFFECLPPADLYLKARDPKMNERIDQQVDMYLRTTFGYGLEIINFIKAGT